jgi:hypothetical protein
MVVWNLEVISNIRNVIIFHTQVISSSQKQNNANVNDDEENNNNNLNIFTIARINNFYPVTVYTYA